MIRRGAQQRQSQKNRIKLQTSPQHNEPYGPINTVYVNWFETGNKIQITQKNW